MLETKKVRTGADVCTYCITNFSVICFKCIVRLLVFTEVPTETSKENNYKKLIEKSFICGFLFATCKNLDAL